MNDVIDSLTDPTPPKAGDDPASTPQTPANTPADPSPEPDPAKDKPDGGGFVPFEVKAAGETIRVETLEQARELASKGYDYGKKTQELAAQRKEAEQKIRAGEAALAYQEKPGRETLSAFYETLGWDSQQIQKEVDAMYPQSDGTTPPATSPDSPGKDPAPTPEDKRIAELEKSVQRLTEMLNSAENHRLDEEVDRVLTSHPKASTFLKSLPEAEASAWRKDFERRAQELVDAELEGKTYSPADARKIAEVVVDKLVEGAARLGLFRPDIFVGGANSQLAVPDAPPAEKRPDLNDRKTSLQDVQNDLRGMIAREVAKSRVGR